MKRPTFVRKKKIFGWLQDGLYLNCTSIARDLEVSVKTAARDVGCLRDEWELPIGYDGKRHGFYFTEKVERLPWVPVTEAELFAVCISSKVLELYDGMPFQKPLELAFAKMTRSLDDEERYMLENLDLAFSFRPFAPEDADLRVLELVTRAVAECRALKFSYRKPGEKKAEVRRVQPYDVFSYEGRMYLLAHDPCRGAMRTFVLGRMSEPTVTSERFARPKDFDPKKEFSTSLGVMKGEGDYQVVIEMDAWLTDVLRGRRFQVRHGFAIGAGRAGTASYDLPSRTGSNAQLSPYPNLHERTGTVVPHLLVRFRYGSGTGRYGSGTAWYALPSRTGSPFPPVQLRSGSFVSIRLTFVTDRYMCVTSNVTSKIETIAHFSGLVTLLRIKHTIHTYPCLHSLAQHRPPAHFQRPIPRSVPSSVPPAPTRAPLTLSRSHAPSVDFLSPGTLRDPAHFAIRATFSIRAGKTLHFPARLSLTAIHTSFLLHAYAWMPGL